MTRRRQRVLGAQLHRPHHWRGAEKVYNPFDILLLFDTREFGPHWFESATRTFLVETLFQRRVSALELDGMLSSDELLSTFDVERIATKAVLFQTEDSSSRGRADMAVRFG